MSIHNERCAAMHLGAWMIEPEWMARAVASVRSGLLKPMAVDPRAEDGKSYAIGGNETAVIRIAGPMMKGDSKYGGANSVRVRQAIRAAANDPAVASIMLHIDSPGGTVDGTLELANEVTRARESKPVFAHLEDYGASAAYWVASQAERITANAMAQVGSIGTMLYLQDTSGAAQAEGIKVIVLGTGTMKGAFAPGAPITDEQIAYAMERLNEMNGHFLAAVKKGRGMTAAQINGIAAEARIYMPPAAKELGLIDGIASFEQAMAAMPRRKAVPSRRMAAELRIAKMA